MEKHEIYKGYKDAAEARAKTKTARIGWTIYFIAVIVFTFFPEFYIYGEIEPFYMGMSNHLFKGLLSSALLIGGLVTFELTTWSKWRGDKR